MKEGIGAFTTTTEDYLPVKKVWLNTSISSGLKIRKIGIAITYLPPAAFTEWVSYAARTSAWQLQANYYF